MGLQSDMRKFLRVVTLMGGRARESCGGGGGGGAGSVCQQIGASICTKACACREGATCAMSQGGLEVTFPSEADCRGLFVTFGCSMGDAKAYNDAAACLPLVQAATCMGTGAEGALTFPPDMACQSPP
jgi:hypothetical protein